MKRTGIRRGIYLLPNLITTASLFCGFLSIISSIQTDYIRAAWLILLAGIFDGLDGRVARLTRTHSDFGIEYDSLCDLTSFGLAPSILAYTWTLHHFRQMGWAAAFLFFTCGALRLARYNVQIDDVEKKHFQGLPIPTAAYVVASYVIFHFRWRGGGEVSSMPLLILMVGLALLMVSNIKYFSFKKLDFRRKESFFVLVAIAIALFIVASAPSETIFLFSLFYVALGIANHLFQFYRRKTRPSDKIQPVPESQDSLRVVHGDKK